MLKHRIFDYWELIVKTQVAPKIRHIGKTLAQYGYKMQMPLTSDDRLVPSLRNLKMNNKTPNIQQCDFVAPNSVIIGDVQAKQNSSIWYGATLRGELGPIEIGQQTVIQDLVNIKSQKLNQKTSIGDNVFIGPNSYIQACQLEDNAFIGMGATVANGCRVSSSAVVSAGAVLQENTTIPSNQVWAGNPAQYLRDITPEEKQVIQEHLQECIQLARIHAEETEKSFREYINDMDQMYAEQSYDPEDFALQKLQDLGFPMEFEDEDYMEQRIHMKEKLAPEESEFWKKNYDPYEQDLFHFPDNFKTYQQNYDKYDEIKKYFDENPNVERTVIDREFSQPKYDAPWSKKY
ncbi:transcription factor apfi, putative [Ichthyophthirius multifiliis]|uniref:Transcription factor apfi, putative n=1 Tax=Ichthyophthirius multifiliis TaxID=5932 RepID=G0QXE6_ICHMU|nr:transcription factor apfi, putative [Ichthyophthirius multifiliis]EGR30110.1 transcription factor apfi, putative [Ichthyophthirius multifiliis]|eukprot:XP_004031346.1 transcription factor apfi, putative [Ichthyophthirius multifiliis]